MSEDDSDDPVMALLATQRAVLAAVENLAAQVEAMQGQLGVMAEAIDRLTGDQASAAPKGAPVSLGARFRIATGPEADADPELQNAYRHYRLAKHLAETLNRNDPAVIAADVARAHDWIADQLDKGRVFDPLKSRDEGGVSKVVVEPIHEEMLGKRIRVERKQERERERSR